MRELAKLNEKLLGLKSNDDYVVNEPQMKKLSKVFSFFIDAAQKNDGQVELSELIPKELSGGVTANFIVFDIGIKDIEKFCEAMRYTSGITIDSTNDGVCISVTVPDVFVPISKNQ